jgi:hypothetical protein
MLPISKLNSSVRMVKPKVFLVQRRFPEVCPTGNERNALNTFGEPFSEDFIEPPSPRVLPLRNAFQPTSRFASRLLTPVRAQN